jgi:hypothetical protein
MPYRTRGTGIRYPNGVVIAHRRLCFAAAFHRSDKRHEWH